MRRCNIPPPSCRHKYAAPCCKDCREADCPTRCQNDPARCRCCSEGPPRKKRKRKTDSLKISWLYSQGLTQVQIAEMLGCNRKTVGAILREMGVISHGKS